MRWLRSIDDFPAVVVEHFTLFIRKAALRVVKDQPRAQRRKGRINVDRVRIAGEIHSVNAVIGEVTAQPLDTLEVCCKAMLHNEVFAEAKNVSSVKQRLFFRSYKELLGGPLKALCLTDFLREVIGVIVGIGQTRLRRSFMAELGILFPILLHQGAVIEVFEPTATIGHRRFEDFRTNGKKHITRRHTSELARGVEIWGRNGERVINGGRTVHSNAALFELRRKVIKKLICAINRLLRTAPPLSAHIAIFGHLGVERRLLGRDVTVICTPYDDVFQRVPFVPTVDHSFLHSSSPNAL